MRNLLEFLDEHAVQIIIVAMATGFTLLAVTMYLVIK